MARKSSKPKIDATSELDVTFGVFNMNKYRVPYMTSVLSFGELHDYLNLVTDDPKYALQDWSLDELFQREVDHARVMGIVKNYLSSSSERPQFFNSLTVVLAPDVSQEKKYIPPVIEDTTYCNSKAIGPVSITYDEISDDADYPGNGAFGKLAWNRDQVSAVAIDGQHRLAAIKEYVSQNKTKRSSSSVSVIFLLIDENTGFLPADVQISHVMRSLFIDLNKHAVPVTRARNLLLDDHDPSAKILRTLFSHKLSIEYTTVKSFSGLFVGTNDEFDINLPLNLIDWHGESKSKIDTGPYVASVLSLDWIVETILKKRTTKRDIVPAFFNPDDEDPYKKIRKLLETWKITYADKNLDLKGRLTECEEEERPFNLTLEDVDAISNEFSQLCGRPITRVFTQLGGYRDVVKLRVDAKSITPAFGQWYQAKEASEQHAKSSKDIKNYYDKKYEEVKGELLDSGLKIAKFTKLIDQIEKLKKDSIFFYIVGQRAIFLAYMTYCNIDHGPTWIEDSGLGKADKSSFTKNWLDFYSWFFTVALNDFYDKSSASRKIFGKDFTVTRSKLTSDNGISDRFWAGSMVKRDDPAQVDFNGAASIRTSNVIVLIVAIYWFKQFNQKKFKDKAALKKVLKASLDDKSALNHFKFGDDLSGCITSFLGPDDAKNRTYYNNPMWFLTSHLETWSFDLSMAAATDRIFAIVDLLYK